MYNNDMLLSLKSDTFSALKEDFDSILARTIGNMEMKGAEEATITLKLGISLEKSTVSGPGGIQDITKPSFKHDISSVMQVKDKKSGALTGDYELVWDADEGKYVMRRIDNGQMNIFDDDGSVIDADYKDFDESRALPEGPRGLPDGEDSEEENDTEYGENPERDDASESGEVSAAAETPFGWLRQFIGQDLRITEAMGNYTVRTMENRVVLSSATGETSPFYCPSEKLEPHVGHHVVCVGYGEEEIVNISIECEDCCEVVYDLDAPEQDDEDETSGEVPEDGYGYDAPEEEAE